MRLGRGDRTLGSAICTAESIPFGNNKYLVTSASTSTKYNNMSVTVYRRHIYFMYPPVSAVSRDANETDKLCDMKQCSTNSKRQHIGAKRSSVAFKIRQNAFLGAVAGAPLRTPLGKLPGPPIVGWGGDTPPHT